MKNKKILTIISSIALISVMLTGCTSNSINKEISVMNDGLTTYGMNSASTSNSIIDGVLNLKGSSTNYDYTYNTRQETEYIEEEIPTENTSKITENYLERKIVYSANIDVQTKNMDEAQKQIYSSIEKYEGYIENENFSNSGNIFSDYTRRSLRISIRIPSKNFNEFINGLENENVYVRSLNKGSKDYSEEYYDKDSRINSLRIQEERLLELLKDANDIDTMLNIENRLSNIRYEIESLTKEMKFIDARVEYSTIDLYIDEVVEYDRYNQEPKNFFEEMIEAVKESAENFIEWIQEAIIAVIYLFPYGIIILIIILLIRKSIKKRRIKKLEKKKKLEEEQNNK